MTLDPLLLLVDLMAIWRLTRLVTRDDFPPVKAARDWILRRWPSDDAEFPDAEVIRDGSPDDAEFGAATGTLATGVEVEWTGVSWQAVHGHWFGKLISCSWCASVWISAAVVALRFNVGNLWQWPAVILALAGAAALIASKVDR